MAARRRRGPVAVALIAIAACTSGQTDQDVRTGANDGTLTEAAYQPINAGRDLVEVSPTAMSTGDSWLFAVGGHERVNGALNPLPESSLYSFTDGVGHAVDEWPFERGLYMPAVQWNGRAFVVVGTPCGVVPDDASEANCQAEAQAAAFNPESETWQRLPDPGAQLDLPTDLTSIAIPLGLADGVALFTYDNRDGIHLIGLDANNTWRNFGPAEVDEWPEHCVVGGQLLRARVEDQSVVAVQSRDLSGAQWADIAKFEFASGNRTDSLLYCADNSLAVLSVKDLAVVEMYWLDNVSDGWVRSPVPHLKGFECCLTLSTTQTGWRVVWPSPNWGNPQVLGAGGSEWAPVSDRPDADAQLISARDSVVVLTSREGAVDIGEVRRTGSG